MGKSARSRGACSSNFRRLTEASAGYTSSISRLSPRWCGNGSACRKQKLPPPGGAGRKQRGWRAGELLRARGGLTDVEIPSSSWIEYADPLCACVNRPSSSTPISFSVNRAMNPPWLSQFIWSCPFPNPRTRNNNAIRRPGPRSNAGLRVSRGRPPSHRGLRIRTRCRAGSSPAPSPRCTGARRRKTAALDKRPITPYRR